MRILLPGPTTSASDGDSQLASPGTSLSQQADIDTVEKVWKELVDEVQPAPSDDTKNAVPMSITRSAFNFCQKRMVKLKEGDTLLLEREQLKEDLFQEAGFETDEATLFRLGGSALYSSLQSQCHTKEHSILQCMQLLSYEKIDMPSNIRNLYVHGGLVFMKKEFLGYLSQVHTYTKCTYHLTLCAYLDIIHFRPI